MPTSTSAGSSACSATMACRRASPLHPIRHPALGQRHPPFVEHADVVVAFRPVDPHEDHSPPPLRRPVSPEGTRGALMDQCSRHVIPPAVSFPSPTGGGPVQPERPTLTACR